MLKILQGDWIEQLKTIPDNSIHCCVTSPPYWRLRDYKSAGQVGLESSIEEYIAKLVAGFEEVRRVLRHDGTLWLNLGDTIQSKRVMGIPWRVAFALQSAGWYLRSDIIWNKPNAMPESVIDRPAKTHEYIFLLSKSPRYYYDTEAVKEPVSGTAHARGNGINPKAKTPWKNSKFSLIHVPGRNPRPRQNASFSGAVNMLVSRRHKRSVWNVATYPYKGAHYATFPPRLIEPCILAGTSEHGCCASCGAPYTRIIEKGAPLEEWRRACGGNKNGEYTGQNQKNYQAHKAQPASTVKARILAGMVEKKTVGWKKSCKCEGQAVVPCTVLDPFGGSGTTAAVALERGRKSILIELNPDSVKLAEDRTKNITPYADKIQRQHVSVGHSHKKLSRRDVSSQMQLLLCSGNGEEIQGNG